MANGGKPRPQVVTIAFARTPTAGYRERIAAAAGDDRLRLAAELRADGHGFAVLLILYSYKNDRRETRQLAHDLLGTAVSHEAKIGPMGLKTIR